MPKKKKLQRIDGGLGPREKEDIRKALRKVWQYSLSRKKVLNRVLNKDGFPVCEKCKRATPKVYVDHIEPVGQVDRGFIERMWCHSNKLQGLCKACHSEKTKIDNMITKLLT